jgi:hypothetical protein
MTGKPVMPPATRHWLAPTEIPRDEVTMVTVDREGPTIAKSISAAAPLTLPFIIIVINY